ncbi:MAG: hypothetical protein ITG02_05115 [Patulibacter sp.]|nr:hypothetical protein [Patulibacter sp.]
MPGLLSASELTRERVERLLYTADGYREGRGRHHPTALLGLVFWEDSLRTRVGFEAAAARLGARTTTVLAPRHTALMEAEERLDDALRSIASWCDLLLVRHPEAIAVARRTGLPIVNCGNGDVEHPTQALIDLATIRALRGAIDGVRIGIVGDLHGMRTAHSLTVALARFDDVTVRLIAPDGLDLPEPFAAPLYAAGHRVERTVELRIEDLDVVYATGLPAPTRIGHLSQEQQAAYRITPELLRSLADPPHVLTPLPRVNEIDVDVDELPQAAYFRHGEVALSVRMAIIDELLSRAR